MTHLHGLGHHSNQGHMSHVHHSTAASNSHLSSMAHLHGLDHHNSDQGHMLGGHHPMHLNHETAHMHLTHEAHRHLLTSLLNHHNLNTINELGEDAWHQHNEQNRNKTKRGGPISCATAMLILIILLSIGSCVVLGVGIYLVIYKPEKIQTGGMCLGAGLLGLASSFVLYKYRDEALYNSGQK